MFLFFLKLQVSLQKIRKYLYLIQIQNFIVNEVLILEIFHIDTKMVILEQTNIT